MFKVTGLEAESDSNPTLPLGVPFHSPAEVTRILPEPPDHLSGAMWTYHSLSSRTVSLVIACGQTDRMKLKAD